MPCRQQHLGFEGSMPADMAPWYSGEVLSLACQAARHVRNGTELIAGQSSLIYRYRAITEQELSALCSRYGVAHAALASGGQKERRAAGI
jgi:hypothetical protein